MTRRRRALADLDQDIRDHLERETQENIERGMSPADARAAALRKFGNVGLIEEQTRAVWRRPWIDQLWHDLLFAFRILRRAPGFTAIAVLTLAVGIGLNTAVFSVVNSVLLLPLEYPHPERLVWLGEYDPAVHHDLVMLTDAAAWRTAARSYDGRGELQFRASCDYHQPHRVFHRGRICRRRLLEPDRRHSRARPPFRPRREKRHRDLLGPVPAPVRRRLTRRRQRRHGGRKALSPSQAFCPGSSASSSRDGGPLSIPSPSKPTSRFHRPSAASGGQVVASLKPGVSISQAFDELKSLQRSLHPPNASQPPSRATLHVELLHDELTSGARRALAMLLAAGALLLLMVSVNIASLLLARVASRRRELAIRLAIGAAWFRTLRQLLVESLTLAFLGGAAGLLLAQWTVLLLARLGPASIPRLDEASIDLRVLAFTFCITLTAGILFGIAPGFTVWRTDLHDALKAGARGTGGLIGLRIRRVMVAGELALALMLLTGAGLLLASFLRMNARPAAFTPDKILVMKMRLPPPRYSRAMQQRYRDELLRRFASIPGVEAAGMFGATDVLLRACVSRRFKSQTDAFAAPELRDTWLSPRARYGIEEGALAHRLRQERRHPAEREHGPGGLRLGRPDRPHVESPAARRGSRSARRLALHEARCRRGPGDLSPVRPADEFLFDIAVRAPNLSGIPAAVRREMAAIDPSLPPWDMKTLREALADSISSQRFNLLLLGSFALAAFVLALVGIYGVVTYSVAARTREIGVRVALGARRGNVIGMVMREGMTLGVAGIVAGLAASYALTRLMTGLLYGVKATDPRIFAVASATLAVTVLFASWWPARNAASIEPVTALRDE